MRRRILFAIFAAGISMILAGVPPAQPHRSGPAEIYPDPVRTPGAANPQVTQQNIRDTICNRHWSTKLIRPPAEYTSKLNRQQLRQYGDTVHQTRTELINPNTGKVDTTRCVAHSDNMACYEEDHLSPLEDGGNPTDPRNLWPEPFNPWVGGTVMGAHQKDGDSHGEQLKGIISQSRSIGGQGFVEFKRNNEKISVTLPGRSLRWN